MKEKTFSYPELTKNFSVEVKKIFEVFLKDKKLGGDEIRLVGGCVRDMIAGLKIKDFDFATKFLPNQIIEILQQNNIHAVPTGIKFGTVTAVINQQHFEITTLRKDNDNNGRHCTPQFIDDYFFDAARRDFTINALYLDNQGLVHDYFDGISDLKNNKVKFIGDPNQRIEEDYLRILRFFRFSCRYAKELDNKGLEACIQNKFGIKKLSADRIRNEIFRIFFDAKKDKIVWIFDELEKSKIREEVFSAKLQIDNLQKLFSLEQSLKIKTSEHLKFAALIFNENISIKLEEIFLRLNFSNNEKKYFLFLFNSSQSIDYKGIKEALVFNKKNLVNDFYLLKLSQVFFMQDQEILAAKKMLQLIDEFTLPDFPINGEDLINLGFDGKNIGEALAKAKNAWIDSDFKLQKKDLLKIIF